MIVPRPHDRLDPLLQSQAMIEAKSPHDTVPTTGSRRLLAMEFAGYLAVSVAALALDVGLLTLLASVVHINYLAASAIGYCAGAVLHYILSVRFVFGARRLTDTRVEFVIFSLIGVVGLIATQIILKLSVDGLGLNYLVGKVGAVGVSFVLNFTIRKAMLFNVKPRA